MWQRLSLYDVRVIGHYLGVLVLVSAFGLIAPLVVDLLTGAMVIEKIYGINGVGKLMVDAIAGQGVDYNYVLALGIVFSALYIGAMLVLDILYGIIDPRVRLAKKEG